MTVYHFHLEGQGWLEQMINYKRYCTFILPIYWIAYNGNRHRGMITKVLGWTQTPDTVVTCCVYQPTEQPGGSILCLSQLPTNYTCWFQQLELTAARSPFISCDQRNMDRCRHRCLVSLTVGMYKVSCDCFYQQPVIHEERCYKSLMLLHFHSCSTSLIPNQGYTYP